LLNWLQPARVSNSAVAKKRIRVDRGGAYNVSTRRRVRNGEFGRDAGRQMRVGAAYIRCVKPGYKNLFSK
jgi:hypothetical protein